jgi:hypothetical protein
MAVSASLRAVRFYGSALFAIAVIAGAPLAAGAQVAPGEARAIAREAYVYGFPIVDNYRILYSYFANPQSPEFKAPWNEIHSEARVFTPQDTSIQTPNSDTPYSQLGYDLRAEPLVLTVPAVEAGRYYSLQFIDLYTFNFAYVGTRATGNDAGSYLLAGPRWEGETPPGIKRVFRSETEIGLVLYRTQLLRPDDIDKVRAIQTGYKVQPLSAFLGAPAPPSPGKLVLIPPLSAEKQRNSVEFFRILDYALRFCPVQPPEQEVRARFARLGIDGEGAFEPTKLKMETGTAMREGIAEAWQTFLDYKKDEIDTGKRSSSDLFGTRKTLDGRYLDRMAGAVLGIYGNSREEAMYPVYFGDSDGRKLDGSSGRYELTFPAGQLPPVGAFWSVTMYASPSSLLVPNPINRYLINSAMLPDLEREKDGSLTLYIQNQQPGWGTPVSNWLPAPKGEFIVVMRLYWPGQEAIDGTWKAPPLERVVE